MPFGPRKFLISFVVLVLAIAIGPVNLYAATVGQIKGTITDKETGDVVLGASVMVVGLEGVGAMTDFEGKYIIRRMEPGSYTVRITHLEYNTLEVTEVVVKSDLTVEVTQALEKKIAKLDRTITVRGERDIIEKFETSNQVSISKEQIMSQPVTSVDELLTQVAGVVTNASGEIFIRGGRAGEVAYIVDGVPIGDPLGGLGEVGANLSLVSGSIQEFTVIKDGFDPEYGNALSGIVKITTQTGSKDNTRINMQFITDDFGNKSLNKYSRNNDFVRFSVSGPDPIFKNKILPALGLSYMEDKELTYYFYGQVDKDDGIYQYESYDTPITRRNYGSFNLLGFDIPERKNNQYYYVGNVRFRPLQNLRFILSYRNSQTRYTHFNWNYRYSPNTAPVQTERWETLSLEVSQSVSRSISYEAVMSYSKNSLTRKPGDPNNPGHGLEPDKFRLNSEWEDFDDRNHNGVYDAPEPIINLFPDTATYGYDFTGPAYTFGEEYLWELNQQGGFDFPSDFRFNDNGIIDNLEGEPFIDLNGNGVWDEGDFLRDKNGNGVLDGDRIGHINNRDPEPYIDGDSIVGEDFTDINGNNIYDPGIDLFVMSVGDDNQDLNDNGRHDGPLDPWEPGIPYIDRNGDGIFNPSNARYDQGEPFTDMNGNGRYDYGGSSNFLNPGSYDETAMWHYHNTNTYRLEAKVFWQLGSHELKGGVAMQANEYDYEEIEKPYYPYSGRDDGGPYPGRGSFRDMFHYEPYQGTVYFRDKLEYGSMIASLGFRWDFFLQDRYGLVEVAKQDDLGSGTILGDRQKFSPRIGFSYPISDKAKIHFNYGHFFQLPLLERMYRRNTSSVAQNVVIGNYNLDYQKTIQYSFGVKYAMSENYSLDASGYFKDEFDKINSAQVQVGGLTRQQYQNSDYGRSRGFEFTLEKRGGGYVNGQLSYTYAFAFGKASQTNQNYMSDFELSREPLSESALDNDVRHRINGNIQVFVPSTVKPRLFGLPIPNGWSLALNCIIESGRPFTPDRSYPNLSLTTGEDIQTNSMRMPGVFNIDFRFTKDFEFIGIDYSVIMWVENIFDSRNVNTVYNNTGRPDTRQNQSQIIKGGTPYDLNPYNWDYGRQVRLGLEVNL